MLAILISLLSALQPSRSRDASDVKELYRLQRERTMNGKIVTDDWRFTKVYARSQGTWRVVAWHASPAAPGK